MENILIEFLTSFWLLANDMAIYIIFGVLIAGVLKQIIPKDFVSKHLGDDNFSSVIKSSLFGIPLPLCSCSVIPFATTLKKEGASSGSVLSFLISTPITGADSILATYGFFGIFFTIYRVITSLIIAIIAGILENFFGRTPKEETQECKSCCSGGACSSSDEVSKFSIKKVFDYAIFDIFKDFSKPLFWGLVAGAIITTFMPQNLSDFLNEYRYLSYAIILIISMPLYICATASLPLASSLIASGLSAGSAFILLSAGPATNSVTMGVVLKTLGKRALIIYLAVIGVFSTLFGYILDLYFADTLSAILIEDEEKFNLSHQISAIIMLGFIAYFFIKDMVNKLKIKGE
ncbi:Transporter [hydrothermal vent metagenome]|uniref:Transporter n=1 Tax=hydrothermal vent metagenome TaxID=652676 RepID=A0A1W1EJU5_9ZZZZ